MKEEYKKALQIPGYIVIAYLAYSFLTHGLGAIQQNPGFISLIMSMGIPYSLASVLVVIIGIVDLLVVIALYTYRNKWVLLYAAI